MSITFGDIHSLRRFGSEAVEIHGKQVSSHVVREHQLLLQVRDFTSEADCLACYEEMRAAVFRAVAGRLASAYVAPLEAISRGGWDAPDNFPREMYEPWPARHPETDGFGWMMFSYVLPEQERILLMPTFTGRVFREISPTELTAWLRSSTRLQKTLSEKEQLALHLVAEANAQHSLKLAFLGLINALEVLIEDSSLTTAQSKFVGKWQVEIHQAATDARELGDDELAVQLDEISERLSHPWLSIQNGLRRLVADVPTLDIVDSMSMLEFEKAESLPSVVSKIYAVRSELIHNGQVRSKTDASGEDRLRSATSLARYVIYCVLYHRLSPNLDRLV